jgi:hypothetical protein
MRFRILFAVLFCTSLCAQQAPSESPQPKPAGTVSATARLLNAKTVFVKQIAGNDVVFDMVKNAIVGWPRYIVVDSPEKADLLVEISAPEAPKKNDESGKTSVQGGAGGQDPRAMRVPPPSYSSNDVKLVVRDAHTRAILWAGSEVAKEAFRQAKTDQNLVDATQKVVQRFHDRIEPPASSTAQQKD